MVVYYDGIIDAFVIESDDCGDCHQPLYDTGCDAPSCNGRCCMDCGTGCDIEFVTAEQGGRCASALAEESDEEFGARINRERAAFGLSPAGGAE